ncbi:MAG: ribosome silencing factor [Bacteroidales bacterium]|nr:ribosome silencing factor [Bacteroidales bacterium]MBS3776003.1 ribosome silencing factor [Bacteroidales bacterium]
MKISKEEEITKEALLDKIIKGIQDKKGKEIVSLKIGKIENSICDYFVICHGTSSTHVDAIIDSIEQRVKKELNEKPYHKEGLDNLTWVLIDYASIIIHVFQKEYRDFYNLEDLWADATMYKYEDVQ